MLNVLGASGSTTRYCSAWDEVEDLSAGRSGLEESPRAGNSIRGPMILNALGGDRINNAILFTWTKWRTKCGTTWLQCPTSRIPSG